MPQICNKAVYIHGQLKLIRRQSTSPPFPRRSSHPSKTNSPKNSNTSRIPLPSYEPRKRNLGTASTASGMGSRKKGIRRVCRSHAVSQTLPYALKEVQYADSRSVQATRTTESQKLIKEIRTCRNTHPRTPDSITLRTRPTRIHGNGLGRYRHRVLR